MLKLFPYELYKIFKNKIFAGALVGILAVNIFLLWYTHRPADNQAPLESYHDLAQALSALPNEQRLDYITAYHEAVKGIAWAWQILTYESRQTEQSIRQAENLRKQDPDAWQYYYDLWESGDYLSFTQNILQEEVFAKAMLQEMTTISQYSDFLADIQNNADTLSGISIFSKNVSDGFSARNIKKTADDYADMTNIPVSYEVSYGVTAATDFVITDFLAFSFLLVFAFIMLYEEKSKNLYAFIQPTPRGGAPTMASKILVLTVYTALISFLLYGGNLLFFHFTTGLGSLNRSIQSIGQFMGSPLHLSVGQFLLCYLLLKWLACFLVGLLVLCSSAWFRRMTSAFGVCALVLLGSFALYTFIPDNSRITLLKHINIFSLFCVQDMLGQYLNLNLYGYPISLFALRMFVILLLISILIAVNIWLFIRRKGSFLALRKKKCLPALPAPAPSKSLLWHELFKALHMNKAGLILIVYLLLILYSISHSSAYRLPDEIIYQNYMKQLEGPMTPDKIANLEAERLRPDVPQSFERVWEKYCYISENPAAHFVYDTGYIQLFGISEENDGTAFLFLCLAIILSGYAIFPLEDQAGTTKLLMSAPLGRRYLARLKLLIGMIFSLFIGIINLLQDFITVGRTYGFSALTAPISSLVAYRDLPSFFSIAGFIILCSLLKLMAGVAVALLVMAIARAVKNPVYTLLLCILTIGLPAAFTAMGLTWAGYLSFIPIFKAAAWLARGQNLIVLLYTAAALILSIVCSRYVTHRSSRST